MNYDNIKKFILFIGQPRSGHTLVGQLLDAHKKIAISHELNVLDYLEEIMRHEENRRKRVLFNAIINQCHNFHNRGHKWVGYDYSISESFQGKYEDIEIIGDKKGGGTTKLLERNMSLLSTLSYIVDVPITLIYVIRHPLDNITTIAKKRFEENIDKAIDFYKKNLDIIERVFDYITTKGDKFNVIIIRLEHLIKFSDNVLEDLINKLFKKPDKAETLNYISKCKQIIFKEPKLTRHELEWNMKQITRVKRMINDYNFVEYYE